MKIILLPGLGADADLFRPQRERFGDDLIVASPTRSEIGSTFAEAGSAVAQRLASDGLFEHDYALGGVSFGGSLAIEIAKHAPKKPARLMLIAANRTSDSLPLRFRFARTLGGVTPRRLAPSVLRRLAAVFGWREGLDPVGQAWLAEIAERVDLELLLWGARAIAAWRSSTADAEALGIPIHQVHGRRDWVIPCRDQDVTFKLNDGRHLVHWTHADVINAWLADPHATEAG